MDSHEIELKRIKVSGSDTAGMNVINIYISWEGRNQEEEGGNFGNFEEEKMLILSNQISKIVTMVCIFMVENAQK